MSRPVDVLLAHARLGWRFWPLLWHGLRAQIRAPLAALVTGALLVATCLVFAHSLEAWASPSESKLPVIRLHAGEIAPSASTSASTPPASGWSPVVLSDSFKSSRVPGPGVVWVRLRFTLDAVPAQPLVLLAQRVVTTAEFYINGSLLNPGVRFGEPGGPASTQMLHWPHWLQLPSGILRAGDNELLVRLQGNAQVPAYVHGLSIGTSQALRGEFLLRDIPQRVVPQLQCVLMLVALVVGLRVWWQRREPMHHLVVLTTLLWLAATAWHLSPDLPISHWQLNGLACAVWISCHWALLLLLWRLTAPAWPWFPRALAIGSALPLLGAGLALTMELADSWLALLVLPTIVMRSLFTVLVLQWAWRSGGWRAWALAGSELLWFAGPVQLMLVVAGVLPPDPFMLAPGSSLPLLLVLMWMGANQLATQRDRAAMERHAAVLAERQRLMLDMHDGVSPQLVRALRLARRDDTSRETLIQTLQDALHDLRALVDARDDTVGELAALLGHWRLRNHASLQALGLRVEWKLEPLPRPLPLSPDEALNVLRILQEALNNVVQHAASSTITILLHAVDGACELQVADDGVGADAALTGGSAAQRGGRGLQSMRQRAARLGATLDVQPGASQGTVVSLRIPFAQGALP